MKKLFIKSFISIVLIAIVGGVNVFAAGGIKSASFNANKVILDGKTLNLGAQQMISVVKDGEQNMSNYMPVRGVLEAMGYKVDWDGQKQAIILTSSADEANSAPASSALVAGIKSSTFNSNKVILDGKELNLGGQQMISVIKEGEQNMSNYMPVRGVLEAMGYKVDWDGQNQAVIVTSSQTTPLPIPEPEIKPETKPSTDGTIAPTKELLNGYWKVADFGYGNSEMDDFSKALLSEFVITYYFDTKGNVASYVEIFGESGYMTGTYLISGTDTVTTKILYTDINGENLTYTGGDIEETSQVYRFSSDGSKLYMQDTSGADVWITLTKDEGKEIKKYQ